MITVSFINTVLSRPHLCFSIWAAGSCLRLAGMTYMMWPLDEVTTVSQTFTSDQQQQKLDTQDNLESERISHIDCLLVCSFLIKKNKVLRNHYARG